MTAAAPPGEIGRRRLPETAHAAVPVAVLAVWALAIRHLPLRQMTDFGLVSVLPATVFAALLVLTVSFCISLRRRPLGALVPLVHVVALVVMLYGITAFVEAEPRFAATWTNVGIVDYIRGHGSVNPRIDDFFSWPGFYALGALFTKVTGLHSALSFGAWGPLLFNLLFLAPLVMIFRWASDDPRLTWLGLFVFYACNWVGQDYTSNQAVAYTLWLVILAALLTWFTPRPAALAAAPSVRSILRLADVRRWRWRRPEERRPVNGSTYQRVALLVTVLVIYSAIVTGHQLTPVSAVLTVIGLTLFARLEPRRLAVIMIVLLAVYISYMTTVFLSGQARSLIELNFSQNLSQSAGARVAGSHAHQLIVIIREVASVGIWLLAAAGFGRRLRARQADIGLMVIAAAPFLQPIIQPYGGEILLRVFLFALPAVAFAIACLAYPTERAGRTWVMTASVTVGLCVLLGLFQYTRYGNERLDHYTKGDLATVQAFYRRAPRGVTVYGGTTNLPWRYVNYASDHYDTVTSLKAWGASRPNPATLAAQLATKLATAGGGYVIITRSTEVDAEMIDGEPHVLGPLAAVLRSSPSFQELYRNTDGDLFEMSPSTAQSLRRAPQGS